VIAPLLDLAEQLATIRNLLMAAFMAAQDLGEPDKRGGLVTLLHLTAEKLRDAETALARIRDTTPTVNDRI